MQRARAESVMRSTGWLAATPVEFQDTLLANCDFGHVDNGTQLYMAGDDESDSLIGIAAGRCSVWLQPNNDVARLIHIFGAGGWTGDLAALMGGPRRVMIKTVGEVWRFRCLKPAIQATTTSNPATWQWFSLLFSRNFEIALSAIDALLSSNPEERIAKTLLRLSRADPISDSLVHCSQTELGSMTGLSRSHVNAALAALEADGTIQRRYGAIQILDSERLQQL